VSDELETDIVKGQFSWKGLLGLRQAVPQTIVMDGHKNQVKGLLVQELDALKQRSALHTRGLRVQYYVDEEGSFIKPGDVSKRLESDASGQNGPRVILVSGPDGFIEYWAGKKLWVGGQEVQGPLGGILRHMDLKGWNVFKL